MCSHCRTFAAQLRLREAEATQSGLQAKCDDLAAAAAAAAGEAAPLWDDAAPLQAPCSVSPASHHAPFCSSGPSALGNAGAPPGASSSSRSARSNSGGHGGVQQPTGDAEASYTEWHLSTLGTASEEDGVNDTLQHQIVRAQTHALQCASWPLLGAVWPYATCVTASALLGHASRSAALCVATNAMLCGYQCHVVPCVDSVPCIVLYRPLCGDDCIALI